MRPPHTHPWPNLLSPPAGWITTPRSALRTIALKDATKVGTLVPGVLSGDRQLDSGGIWPPHTHPWPNLLSPPADWITAPRSASRTIGAVGFESGQKKLIVNNYSILQSDLSTSLTQFTTSSCPLLPTISLRPPAPA